MSICGSEFDDCSRCCGVDIEGLEKENQKLKELLNDSLQYVEYAVKYSTPLSQKKAEELILNIENLLGEEK